MEIYICLFDSCWRTPSHVRGSSSKELLRHHTVPYFDFSHLISQALHSCVILLPYINLNPLVIFPDL